MENKKLFTADELGYLKTITNMLVNQRYCDNEIIKKAYEQQIQDSCEHWKKYKGRNLLKDVNDFIIGKFD